MVCVATSGTSAASPAPPVITQQEPSEQTDPALVLGVLAGPVPV